MGSSLIVGDELRVGSDVLTFYKSSDFEAIVDINIRSILYEEYFYL